MRDPHRLTHLPITSEQADCLFFSEKGKQIAQFVNEFNGTEPFAYAIYGDWGVGKSSLMNFIARGINTEKCKVIRFNPWNLTSHIGIIECLFEEIAAVVKDEKTVLKTLKKYKEKIIRPTVKGVCRGGLAALGVDDIPAEAASETAANVAELMFSNDDPLSIRRKSLYKALLQWAENGKKVVIFIDELDRLLPDEMLNIFKLIKAYLDFPGIFFVVALDNGVAKEALRSVNINKADLFIDKIFQASYTICSERQFKTLTQKILIPTIPETHNELKRLINIFFLCEKDEQLETDRSDNEIESAYRQLNKALVEQFTNPRSFIRLSQYIVSDWHIIQSKLSNMKARDIRVVFAFFLLFYVNPALISNQHIGFNNINTSADDDYPDIYYAVAFFVEILCVRLKGGTLQEDYTEDFSDLIISVLQGYADMRIDGVKP